jgi:ABC-type phosphate/phosphonate transport system substrate-binding protein
MFANARMYSLNPALGAAWRTLLEWVIARAGADCTVIDYPPPQPLPALWARADLGCAFMCGYPLAHAQPQPLVLAAPVPSPARYAGRPVYCTDLIVRAGGTIATLADAWGRRVAFTSTDSMSGYQAPRRFFAAHAAARGGTLFSASVGPLLTPRGVVDAVLAGEADLGPLDSYAHDLLRLHEPQLAGQLLVLASTPCTPIPPLVGAAGMDLAAAQRLRAALLDVQNAAALAPARAALLLHGFARIEASAYHASMAAASEADALGYPRLA